MFIIAIRLLVYKETQRCTVEIKIYSMAAGFLLKTCLASTQSKEKPDMSSIKCANFHRTKYRLVSELQTTSPLLSESSSFHCISLHLCSRWFDSNFRNFETKLIFILLPRGTVRARQSLWIILAGSFKSLCTRILIFCLRMKLWYHNEPHKTEKSQNPAQCNETQWVGLDSVGIFGFVRLSMVSQFHSETKY